jgi:hypothetical protein
VNSSDIILDRGNVVVGNVFPIGSSLTIGGANNDIYIGGLYNTERSQTIYIGQNELQNRGSAVKPSTIYIGGLDDNVILRGNTKILNMQKLVVRGATAFVNLPTEGFGANVTAAGAGIDIFDNSYSTFASNNVYGYMHVGKDMQSFIFKAPSYGSFSDDINKDAQYNTFKNIELLSQENRLGLGVNELSLTGKNIRTGLVVLQGYTDFRSYQSRYGHSYLSGTDDIDHAINLLADFDVSNILLKDFIIDKQNIISEVIVGNTTSSNSIFTYGNVITYGNTILYGNTTTYKDIVTSGNIFIKSSISSTTADKGALVVTGGVGIGGNLRVGSTALTNNTTTGALVVTGGVGIGGNLHIGGNIIASANQTINGVSIDNRAMSNISTIDASGATFTGTASSSDKDTGALVVNGGVGIGGNLRVGSTASSSNKDTGALVVTGGVGIGGNLRVGSSEDSTYGIKAGALVVDGGAYITKKLYVADTAVSYNKSMGALAVNGSVGIGGNINASTNQTINGVSINNRAMSNISTIDASGATFTGTASSSNKDTGALQVFGGVGIGGNLHVGGNLKTSGNILASTNTDTINGVLINATRGISNVTTITADGVITFSNNTGGSSDAGAVKISAGGLFVKENIYLDGTITANATRTINGVSINTRAMSNISTIDASGATFTGTTNGTSDAGAVKISVGGLYVKQDIYVGGKVTAVTGFNSGSDYRIKKDIKPLASSKTIDLLKPVEYSMTNETYEMGFLAHEVQEIFPFLVTGEKDGEKLQTLNYNGFIALLVKEIQDLKSENKLLKSRLDAIENIIGDDNEKSRLERFRDAVHHAS